LKLSLFPVKRDVNGRRVFYCRACIAKHGRCYWTERARHGIRVKPVAHAGYHNVGMTFCVVYAQRNKTFLLAISSRKLEDNVRIAFAP
jgi:hypothetical protein